MVKKHEKIIIGVIIGVIIGYLFDIIVFLIIAFFRISSNSLQPDEAVSAYEEVMEEYEFADDYQANFYLSDVQSHMEEIAEKYFRGEYYVVVETRGEDGDSEEKMPFEACINKYGQYCVYIYVYDIPNEDAYDAMQKFMADVESLGFQYSFYLGRNKKDNKTKYLEYIQGNADYGWPLYVEWIYYKWLPPEERKLEPKVYILAEEE